MIINKIKIILLSRFKTNKEEKWVTKRIATCLGCEYNTLNGGSLKGYRFFLATLSSFYSKITGRAKVDVFGNCTACEACSIYFKAFEKLETCKKGKWEKLEDNSIQLDILNHRKNESNKSNR